MSTEKECGVNIKPKAISLKNQVILKQEPSATATYQNIIIRRIGFNNALVRIL